MMQKLRLKYGLKWMKWHPPLPWKHAAVIALCWAAYLAVAQIDNLSERVKEMEDEGASNAIYAEVLFTCMSAGLNNQVGGFSFRDANKAFECAIREL
jgi:hypothetical protein